MWGIEFGIISTVNIHTGRNNDPGVHKKTLQLTETVSQSLCYTAEMGPSVMRPLFIPLPFPLTML